MAKDEQTTDKTETETDNDAAGAGLLAAEQPTETAPDTPAPPTAGSNTLGAYREESPEEAAEREAKYTRMRALELAAAPGIHEAKEPIASVLARAEAYRTYMETGETGIVA